MAKTALTMAALAGALVYISKSATAAPGAYVPVQQVHDTAARLIDQHGLNASPCMVTAMAMVESGDINNPAAGVNRFATRFEPHLPDTSTGIMQTLLTTAQWLHEIGYTGKPKPTLQALYVPETSIYFGAAYVDWLSKYAGRSRGEDWIVQSYNAGPGGTASYHLNKYHAAKRNLQQIGVC